MKLEQHSVDIIVDVNKQSAHKEPPYVVLIKRLRNPFQDYWALPGGRQEENETLEQTAQRELSEETGLGFEFLENEIPFKIKLDNFETYLDQIRTYIAEKDPRGGNTTTYALQVECDDISRIEKMLKNGSDAKNIGLFRIDELPELAFSHFKYITDYYTKLKRYKNPSLAVDAIIRYNQGIVAIERDDGQLALPGGFAKYGITLEQSAKEEAKEETNLDIAVKSLLGIYSDPNRDPRKHIASAAYIADGRGILRAGSDARNAFVFPPDKLLRTPLYADHNKIVGDFIASQ
ncbi:NUDIX domain-containing protein [Candidatus Woesearchaeota archaeon]|nr:NUDIX domain-containing protein [Candidatus Woesearchaeota archaeon]